MSAANIAGPQKESEQNLLGGFRPIAQNSPEHSVLSALDEGVHDVADIPGFTRAPLYRNIDSSTCFQDQLTNLLHRRAPVCGRHNALL